MAALLTSAVLVSCTDEVPTHAGERVPEQPQFAENSTAFLGTSRVDGAWSPSVPLPPSKWVVVQVSGTVGYKRNPLCWTYPGYCDAPNLPLDGAVKGPLEYGGEIIVNAFAPGVVPHSQSTTGTYAWGPGGEPHGSGSIGWALVGPSDAPRVLWSRSLRIGGSAGNPTGSPGYWDVWDVEGHQSVSAIAINSPLEVSGPAAVSPGQARAFTIQPYGNLSLVRPDGTKPQITWYYFTGDTLPEHNLNAGWRGIPECQNEQVCNYSPPESGRVGASTYVQGRFLRVAGEVVRVEPLDLKCNGSTDSLRITRADNVRCEVSGASEIGEWGFESDSTAYRNPSAGGAPFKGMVWEGQVVLSGTVTVTVLVAGREQSKSVRVAVEARDWTGKRISRQAAEEPTTPGHLPPLPDSVHRLGHIHQQFITAVARDKWEPILSGPNANLAYLVDVPASYNGIVHVNRTALAVGSDFWNKQPIRQRSSGVVDCLRREPDIIGFIPVILRHEGVGFDPKSHAFLYVEAAERVGNPRFERVTGTSLDELADAAEAIGRVVADSSAKASDRADGPGFAPAWCRFHF